MTETVRPIDGNRLAELFESAAERGAGVLATVYRDAAHFARTAPTIEPEVRHGRWETWGYVFRGIEWKRCSRCGKCADVSYYGLLDGEIRMSTPAICGGCGSRMDGGSDDERPDQA